MHALLALISSVFSNMLPVVEQLPHLLDRYLCRRLISKDLNIGFSCSTVFKVLMNCSSALTLYHFFNAFSMSFTCAPIISSPRFKVICSCSRVVLMRSLYCLPKYRCVSPGMYLRSGVNGFSSSKCYLNIYRNQQGLC